MDAYSLHINAEYKQHQFLTDARAERLVKAMRVAAVAGESSIAARLRRVIRSFGVGRRANPVASERKATI